MQEKPDCITCEIWRKAGTVLLCSREDCKDCGKDINGKLAFCYCRNCEYLSYKIKNQTPELINAN